MGKARTDILEAQSGADCCALCGLALPKRPMLNGDGEAFCCQGCLHVATILKTVGGESEEARRRLEAARQGGLISAIAPPRPAIEIPADRREEIRCGVVGMACPSCAWLVEALLAQHEGVGEVEVDFLSDTVRVAFDVSQTSREAMEETVGRAGYRFVSLGGEAGAEERRDWLRLALAIFVGANLMMLAWVGYDAILKGSADRYAVAIAWVQVLFGLPVLTWSAMPLYRRAWAALRSGRAVMETLLSLGILAALGLSIASLVAGDVHVYMETATMLVAISLGGRMAERRLKRRAAQSLVGILQFSPTKARKAEDSRFAPLSDFAVGDSVCVEAGEVVPLDLRSENEVVVREGLVTGEPHPVRRRPGEVILAGSTVESGPLMGTVDRAAGETVADAIRGRVSEALRRADSGSRLADRLAQGFVPLVLLVAGATLIGHAASGAGLKPALLTAVSVLVVACPCAFGVAASSATSLALLRLAQSGVLIKDPTVFESLRSIDRAVFDKTGTLTRGDLSLLGVGWTGVEDVELLAAVRALEAQSRHPIAVSLRRLLPEATNFKVAGVVEMPGLGVSGTVGERRVAVGNAHLFAPSSRSMPPAPGGATRVWFGCAGEEPAGYIDLSDTLKPESRSFVEDLKARGIAMALLSGDAPEPARVMAEAAGVAEAIGDLRPEEKAARIRALRESGKRVVYVGDGFNDADALAAADVGIALGTGADLALLSAPVVITKNNLHAISDLLDVANQTCRVVRQNFGWAFGYNLALLPMAALGLFQPVYAAALMALSSVTVALNSGRLGARRRNLERSAEGWMRNELVRRPT